MSGKKVRRGAANDAAAWMLIPSVTSACDEFMVEVANR